MDFTKYIAYSTEDFILDEYFQKWVLYPDLESNSCFTQLLELHPEKEANINEAKLILNGLQPVEPEISAERLNIIHNRLLNNYGSSHGILFYAIRIAASLILIIGIGVLAYYLTSNRGVFNIELASEDDLQKGKLVLADGTIREFETEEAKIQQTKTGEITLNNDTVATNITRKNLVKNAMNQVIVPYGKRTEILLADGSRIWLNSGSQLSYPAVFTDQSREVYLSGEAFFDIEEDKNRPFHVVTRDMRIRVTGTRFNVSSYENDLTTHAVLVKGGISASRNKNFAKSIDLRPGEMLSYVKDSESMEKEIVNVNLYVSWVNGYLIFKNENFHNIFKKLERYYSKEINIDESISSVTFSGKLDLSDDFQEIVSTMLFASNFKAYYDNDILTIKP